MDRICRHYPKTTIRIKRFLSQQPSHPTQNSVSDLNPKGEKSLFGLVVNKHVTTIFACHDFLTIQFDLSSSSFIQVISAHRSEEHTSELQSPCNLVCRLLLEKKK